MSIYPTAAQKLALASRQIAEDDEEQKPEARYHVPQDKHPPYRVVCYVEPTDGVYRVATNLPKTKAKP